MAMPTSTRDRETDELRHSIRSVEKHMRWHRGRLLIVSPGHHPQWVYPAKNFLTGACGGAACAALRGGGRHVRVTTVHQDAVLPYGMRLTVDSHTIEAQLWRLANLSSVHVYFNDDYFVNRDVDVTDLFNEYGGTIVRTERGVLKEGRAAPPKSGAWIDGVYNTHLFNIVELDLYGDEHLASEIATLWRLRGDQEVVPAPDLAFIVDAAYQHPPPSRPKGPLKSHSRRRFTTHAPFVYCTNMHRHLSTRYELEFASNTLAHRTRSAADYFIPFVYNAFIMARPWAASPQYLPYLIDLNASKVGKGAPKARTIYLDNVDGCAPASLKSGTYRSLAQYVVFKNDMRRNADAIERIRQVNPLFFNINAGFTWDNCSKQMVEFLRGKFPERTYVEYGDAVDGVAVEADLRALHDALMRLPVVLAASYDEGVCPLVRSLQLALPEHAGPVAAVVLSPGGESAGATLGDARAALRHAVYSAMPTVACAYNERVRRSAMVRMGDAGAVARAALSGLGGGGAAVELPAQCGGALGGLRVHALVVDAQTPEVPVRDARALRVALAMPGQTLALEDFAVVPVGPDARDVVLVLSRVDAAERAVHWISGASEGDLLLTYPVPHAAYEDLSARVQWLEV